MVCYEVGKYDDGIKCVDICMDLYYEYCCVNKCFENFKIFNKICVCNCFIIVFIISWIYDYIVNKGGYRCVKSC